MLNKLIVLPLATGFGLGYAPKAPGTVATLAAVIVAYFMSPFILVISTILVSIIGVIVSSQSELLFGEKDSGKIVIDEISGVWIALLFVSHNLVAYSLVFILFRVLDIAKPSIIGMADKKVQGGLGVMLDDWLAGLASGIAIWILLLFIKII